MAEDTRNRTAEQDRGRGDAHQSGGTYQDKDKKDQTWVFEHDDGNANNAAVTNLDRHESDRGERAERESNRGSESDR